METPQVATPLPDCWVVGNGLLGQSLAEKLRRDGAGVLTLDAAAPADVEGNAAEEPVLRRALSLLVPQVVYCCQATGGGDAAAYRRTYAEVVAALQAAVPAARLVFCSSVSVYGAVRGVVTEETLPAEPSERACVLLETERAVLVRGGVVLRLSPLYSERRCEVLRRHLAGDACLPGSGKRMLNYLSVEDAVSALLPAAAAPSACYNVSGESLSRDALYAMLAEVTGIPQAAECAMVSRRGLSDRRVDCSRLRSLGWSPQMTLRRFAEQCYLSFLPDAS